MFLLLPPTPQRTHCWLWPVKKEADLAADTSGRLGSLSEAASLAAQGGGGGRGAGRARGLAAPGRQDDSQEPDAWQLAAVPGMVQD